jgi:cytochrome c oxidase assembly factor CtaG
VTVLALTGIAVAAVLYWLGTRGAQGSRARRERPWRAQSFYSGLAAVALAVAPPLDGLADRLFWWHMVQHALLQMVAPPLLVLGAPWLVVWRPVSSVGGRRRVSGWIVGSRALRAVGRFFAAPVVAWASFLVGIWLSHAPAVFDFAARHPLVHDAEHVAFLATGILFWSRVLDSPPFRARLTRVRRLGFLLSAGLAEAALAIVILAQHAPLYAPYTSLSPRPEHLTALADQQLGGAIMLEPASIPLLIAIIWSIGGLFTPRRRHDAHLSPTDTTGV